MDRDIVERLREGTGPIKPNLIDDAADTIERLRARIGQLEADASALAAERDEAIGQAERLTLALSQIAQHRDEPYSADYARDVLGDNHGR